MRYPLECGDILYAHFLDVLDDVLGVYVDDDECIECDFLLFGELRTHEVDEVVELHLQLNEVLFNGAVTQGYFHLLRPLHL